MARPIYETPADRENEQAVANLIAEAKGLRAYKLPQKFPLDFALLDSRQTIHRWLEVKCRNVRFDAYPDYMIALSKISAMMDLQRITAIQASLVIRWQDRIGILDLPVTFDVRVNGRPDRSDPQDFEPMAYIALAQFRLVRSLTADATESAAHSSGGQLPGPAPST